MRPSSFRLPSAAVLLLLAACADPGRQDPSPGGFRGAELSPPRAKPEITLTTLDGRPYDFRLETDSVLTLLFFGYTSCPDICPVHLANIAAVRKTLTPQQAGRMRVVFVTTDPERDTPARIRDWLAGFDRDFVGLTGTLEELQQAQVAAGILPAVRDTAAQPGGGYAVGHAAQVIAYTADNLERVHYPFGTRQADWAHDLPRLLRFPVRP